MDDDHECPALVGQDVQDGPWLTVPLPPHWPPAAERVRFRIEGMEPPARVPAEVVVACHLLTAMRAGRPLMAPAATDRRLLEQLPAAIAYLAHWGRELHPVRLALEGGLAARDGGQGRAIKARGRACLFSGGARSLRLVQRQTGKLNALVVVEDAAGEPDAAGLRRQRFGELAREAGCRLVVVSTNLPGLVARCGVAGEAALGVVLAAVGHLLADEFGELLVGAGVAADGVAWGLHPAVLEAWSTDRLMLRRDAGEGGGETRRDMVAALRSWPLAVRMLCEGEQSDTSRGVGARIREAATALALRLGEGHGLEQVGATCRTLAHALQAACEAEAETGAVPKTVHGLLVECGRGLASAGAGEETERCRQMIDRALAGPAAGSPQPTGPPAPEPHWPPGPPLRLALESFTADDGGWEWRLRVGWGEWSDVLWIQLEGDMRGLKPERGNVADTLFCWCAPMAMNLGVPLEMPPDLPVDRELFERWTGSIGEMAVSENLEGMRPVECHVSLRESHVATGEPAEPVVAATFSGGVDACSMAVALQPRLLVYAANMDTWSACDERLARIDRKVGKAARATGIPLVILRTNLRPLGTLGLGVDWRISFRLGLPAAGHLLAGDFNTFAMASDDPLSWYVGQDKALTFTYTPIHSGWLGSSRMRQEFWSSGPWRAERLDMLRGHPEVLANLWVCPEDSKENYDGEIANCGECEKCIRTEVCHRLVGLEPSPRAFAAPLNAARIDRIPRVYGIQVRVWRLVVERLRQHSGLPDLLAAAERLLVRSRGPRPEVSHWMLDDQLVGEWRRLPQFRSWLRDHGRQLAAAVFGNRPANWALQRLQRPGAGRFREAALRELWANDPGLVRQWLRRRRWLGRFRC